ncbi:MAG TPA: VOC family protein [Bryobacteraceae bacterium]|nr:VOC family protein [Bryobacteraceae bacterium]
MNVKKITAVLLAEEVEPCVRFWTGRLGFEKTAEVPDGAKLAFAILAKNGTEIMYQSYASVEKDNPHPDMLARKGPTFLYVEVDDLAAVKAASAGAEIVIPERTTFYGSREFGVKDPAGHIVTFAQFSA